MTSELSVKTFGQLTIQQNDALVEDFISTKAILLFVYLAMHPGDQSRKKLASMFWSETSDQQALKNLRTVLSSVRQCVPDAVIIARDVLAINPEVTIQVDALAFEQGCKTAFSSPKVLDLLHYMIDIAQLYRGTFLADVSFREAAALDDWIANQQRHLQQLYSRLLYEIVELAYKQGDYETGLQYVRRLVDLDPLWDVAQRQMMLLLAYSDRANEALLQYEQFVERLEEELQAEPEEETVELYEQIQSRTIRPAQATGRSTIVLPDMPFIEPATDVEIAQRMLNTPTCRLLTIFGLSGIGKTALATQLAYHRQHLYSDGTCFISLSTAQNRFISLLLIASALGIGVSQSLDEKLLEDMIIKHLKAREMLLVFDNYEQLLPETSFLQRILQEVNTVQIIVTSLVPLNLYREWLVPMRGLSLPDIYAESPQTYEAIRLFELTAQRMNPRFRLDDSLDDVVRICQLVDSLPLGIILAAGWVQYISPAEILARMQDDLLQMESVHHDILPRHQSFRNLLNSMLKHLSEGDQEALMCLSIFEGSFDYKAALAVADITMDDFKNLTDKCLVQRSDGYRYTVHSIVRQAFISQLQQSPLLKTVANRYVEYFQAWCDEVYSQTLPLHKLMHTIDVEQHNLWKVIGQDVTERQQFLMHIAPAMNEYWVNRGYHARGIIELLDAGSQNPAIPAEIRVRGMTTLARMLERTSQYDRAWAICETILELERDLDLPHFRARALRVLSEICAVQAKFQQASEYLQAIIAMESQTSLHNNPRISHLISLAYEDLGDVLLSQGDYPAARRYAQIAIHRWQERGETLRETIARSYLGIITLKEGNPESAYRLFADILTDARNANNQTLITIYTYHLGTTSMAMGNYGETCDLFQEALQIALQIDRKTTIINLIEQFSQLALLTEHYDIGAQLLGFAGCMRDHLNLPIMPHHQADHVQRKQALETQLGAAYDQQVHAGCRMGLMTAVQLTATLIARVQVSHPQINAS